MDEGGCGSWWLMLPLPHDRMTNVVMRQCRLAGKVVE